MKSLRVSTGCCLAEIQPGLLERLGIVAQVRIPAPDVERTARLEHARGVGEPRQEHLIEGLVADEVVFQRSVLGPHLLRSAFSLGLVAGQVEALVVHSAGVGGVDGVLLRGGSLEAGQPGGNGVIGARFDLHVIWRVHVHQVDHRAVEQPIQVFGRTAVAAHEPVVTQQPDIPALRDRIVRRLGNRVRVGQSLGHPLRAAQQLAQFLLVERQYVHVEAALAQLIELDGQDLQIPLGQFTGLVVRQPVGPRLFGREIGGHMHRHLGQSQLLSGLPPRVAGDDHAIGIDDDRLAEAKLGETGRHGFHRMVVDPWIALIGADVVELPQLDGELLHGCILSNGHESTSVCLGVMRRQFGAFSTNSAM
jgi:hypothetical protein